MKHLSTYVMIGVALFGMFVGLGALWGYNFPPSPPALDQAAFPERTSARFSELIEQTVARSGIQGPENVVLTQSTEQEGALRWTHSHYRLRAETPEHASRLIRTLSELIYASGGEVFQTYYQADNRELTASIGIGFYITHTLVFTWPPPAPQEEAPVAEDPPADASPRFKAAIVIDDLGGNTAIVHRLLRMGADFTFSILPHLNQSSAIAALLHAQQKEILLHLPMEPRNYPQETPGRGAVMMQMTADQIRSTIQQNLLAVPFAVGVNNHMGSRFTTSTEFMRIVLQQLAEQDLFFLDSRTTSETVAYTVARHMQVATAQRKVFLDADTPLQVETVKRRLQELLTLAEQGKPAIAIGHPKEQTLQALEEFLPEFERRQVQIIRVSQFTH